MKNIREIISNNISVLRKQQGLTQLDLAKKVSYSDKAVSRWEKGEVMPDIETLQNISNALNVPLAYLLEEHDVKQEQNNDYVKNEIAFKILLILAVWTIASIIFVFAKLNFNIIYWEIYVWAVPASCCVVMYYNRKRKNRLLSLICRTIFCWSLLACVYLQFLNYKAWIIFIIGIPIQAAIVVSYLAKRNR